MQAVYLDAALISELGHFAGACRSVTKSLRGAGVPVTICGHARIDSHLAKDLGVMPLFTYHPNAMPSADPVCGWLLNFQEISRVTEADLQQLQGISAGDLVIYNCARPAQVAAVVSWLQRNFKPEAAPRVVIILGWHPGMRITSRDTHGGIREWRLTDTASSLYRLACTSIRPEYEPSIRFAAPDRPAAMGWSELIARKVAPLPYLQNAVTGRRNRRGTSIPTIAFLGEQRENKGYLLVPEIVSQLLASPRSFRVLVQNSWDQMQDQNEELRRTALSDPRLEVLIGTVSPAEWSAILDRSDLIVLPYDANAYSTTISGIGAEAVANAIPQVVPANTGLDIMLQDYGSPGLSFSAVTPKEVVAAVHRVLDSYDDFASAAHQASSRWAEVNAPHQLAAALLQ
jgi:hypothetical protein